MHDPESSPQALKRAEWFERCVAAAEGRLAPEDAAQLPGFPSPEVQERTTGQAGRGTLQEGFTFYEDTALLFERELGRPLDERDKVLDFGSGWGRILRFFIADVGLENCYGTDVDPELVACCRDLFRSPNFVHNGAFPPTEFGDDTFSLIVGYSVFSHLSEAACRAWMKEFYRILRPGGLVAVTTRGRWFFDYCEGLKETAPEGSYAAGLAELFPDFAEAKRWYDAGHLVHTSSDGVSGGPALGRSFYGETFIPQAWAQKAFLPLMRLVEFYEEPERQTHPILLFAAEEGAAR
jgi:SAM-dependent methyltransferase